MRKKRKLWMTLLLSITLIALFGVGATLAYFTDQDEQANVVVIGHVEADLTEPNFPGGEEGGEIEGKMPGDVIPKDPTVSLEDGSLDAYVRMTMAAEIRNLPEGYEPETDAYKKVMDELMAGISFNTDSWYYVEEDGYYYYNDIVTSDKPSVPLFNDVTIPFIWGNDFENCVIDIDLTAEAIQADGFEPTWDAEEKYIIAWQYTDGEKIETEEYNTEPMKPEKEQQ